MKHSTRLAFGGATDLVDRFAKCRVGVIGDLMLDEFVWGEATRISPEAPVPVVLFERETHTLGGAGNVAANVRALGGEPIVFSVHGRDRVAERVRDLFALAGIATSSIICDANRPTTLKQRVLAAGKHVVRIDRESVEPLSHEVETCLLQQLKSRVPSLDAVLLSDYAKGCITDGLVRGVVRFCRENRVPLCIDPKRVDIDYSGAFVLKPNLREVEELSGVKVRDDAALSRAAEILIERFECEYLLVTRGKLGMRLFGRDRDVADVASSGRDVADVTGAGDTVLATVGVALAANATMLEATVLANIAAGLVVAKPGTEVVHAHELQAALEQNRAAMGATAAAG